MYVIEVTPLVRGTTAETLSYYASVTYPIGAIITVPLRNKDVRALVLDAKPVSKAKTALKAATFSLRKLEEQTEFDQLPPSILETAEKLTAHYPATTGAIMYALLPPDVRSGIRPYPADDGDHEKMDSMPMICTGFRDDRYISYTSHIREAFAHRASVLFVVPNSSAVTNAANLLSQGIEKRVVTFSSTHTKKQIDAAYEAFGDLSNAKLIITTPNFALLERHDLTTIIVDECGSPHYKARTRPYLDARQMLKTYAKVTGKSILLGDVLPPTEDEYERREETCQTYAEHPKRLQAGSNFEIIDHQTEPGTDFTIFTPTLTEFMNLALTNKGRVFLYAARRGLAPLVTCYDCGHVFRCPDSGAPYSLLRTMQGEEEVRWFYSSTSGKRVRAADTCPDCGSWRLREQGVGIQQVEDAVKKQFPKSTVLRFDHETASTHRKAAKLVEQFYTEKNTVLIGTAMSLPYLTKPIDVTAVTSYEALRSVPTWRAEEYVLATLLRLREISYKDCLVQTRSGTDNILKIAKQSEIDAFYDDELDVRKMVGYPPFTHFVLLTYTGTKEQNNEFEGQLENLLAGYETQSYHAPQAEKSGKFARHTLIRVKAVVWPDPHLMDALRTLPPYVKVEVDPNRIV